MTRDIARADVQLLANREQVLQFFHTLGFDVTSQLTQTVDSLDIKGDLRNEIGAIERVGVLTDETWTLEVYLFEVGSITKAVRDGLARAFRNRPWDYLLVLTKNYEQVDFQLVERVETQAGVLQPTMDRTQKFRKGEPKPRVLSVERQNPGDVALRVLRQLRYTGDVQVIDYCEKLRSVYDVAYWSEAYFNNRALFSDYYLKERLPEREEWRRSETTELGALRTSLRQLAKWYADAEEKFADQPTLVVQDTLIAPVLEHLGFAAAGGATRGLASKSGEEREADYLLYLKDSRGRKIGNAVGFCLAYAWGRDLDRKVPLAEDFDALSDVERLNENPGAAVVALLDAGSANWAVVTNGKMWRLYTAKAHSRATNYYEIGLEEIANDKVSDPLEAFRYFWFLFRAEAFRPSEAGEISLLDLILRESEQYAHELGEKLKDRVFDSIFPQFAQGFIEYAKQRGEPELKDLSEQERAERLKEVFDGTLTFLYRLLFLLYAESRALLPVYGRRDYYQYSLEALKATIATKAGISEDEESTRIHKAYSAATSTVLYDQLQTLFKAVDRGDRALNVPTYNGGLFMTEPAANDDSAEAKVARFLHDHKIPDAYLALGLDLMARVEDDKEARLVFVDYKSLGVRQLGSIYEGLLEFKLHVALQEMTVVPTAKGKKSEKIIPWEEAKQQRISPIKVRRDGEVTEKIYKPGEVYLINDRSERKATGSYYTPDYIVKYIVEHTVGEVLTQKMEALKKTFYEAQKKLKFEQDKIKALRQKHHIPSTQEAEHEAYLHFKDTLNEQFFDLKVLDPAMGSGHFLVEAVDYITDRMTHFLEKIGWNPVIYHLGQMRGEIQQQMEEQGIEIDVDKLTDINLLKRQVLKRCIYGVDINPMAVELAKVSVWLDSFTLGAPLSFLDHHLKCGNSLLGVRVRQVREAVEDTAKQQATLFEEVSLWASVALATGGALEVARLSDATAQQVHLSKEKHRDAEKALLPYKNLLNIYTSRWFSNPPTKDRKAQKWYDHVVYFLRSKEAKGWYLHSEKLDALTPEQRTLVKNAAHDADVRHFFHWEMEFPEVFFGLVNGTKQAIELKDDAGFDAVVGNPPYVRQEGLGEDKVAFKDLYSVFNSIADLYTYFIERGNSMLQTGGRFGMITANKFMRANYGAELRNYLTTSVKLEKLIDFGGLPVFGEATTYPIIILSEMDQRNDALVEYALIKSLDFEDLDDVVESTVNRMPESAFRGSSWSLATSSIQIVLDKLRSNSVSLGEYIGDTIRRGIVTGFNEAFFINRAICDKLVAEDPKSAEVIKPFIVGEDVKRYTIDFEERYLIFTRRGIDLTKYKAITQHLLQYKAQLAPKPSNWNDKTQGGWQGRKPGPYKWYEIQDNIAYYADFEKPKIVYPVIAASNNFTLDEKGYFTNDKTFFIPTNNLYLLSILNSSTAFMFFRLELSGLRGGFLEYRAQTLVHTPIRRINFVTSEKDRAYYREKAASLYEYCLGKEDEDYTCVLEFVQHHLTREPEESDVVHDLLAYLAEQMLELNKVKRAKQKEFLSELVRTLKVKKDKDGRVGIDALVGKQQLMEYPGDYRKEGSEPLKSDDLIAILRKNRARLGVSLDSPMRVAENWTYEDEVRRLYKESLVEVLPVKERLRRTDELIDGVVYRLYGLTEEEIGIVEGKA